jgi:hypothetical protein
MFAPMITVCSNINVWSRLNLRAGATISKFASYRGATVCELRNQRVATVSIAEAQRQWSGPIKARSRGIMTRGFGFLLASAGLAVSASSAMPHHSIVMFDHENPIEIAGTVREFRFASPHAFIVLEVKGQNSRSVIWNLEGNSPNSLAWDGWSGKTLRPGDEVRMTIDPLRNGAPGGAWNPRTVRFEGGAVITAVPYGARR